MTDSNSQEIDKIFSSTGTLFIFKDFSGAEYLKIKTLKSIKALKDLKNTDETEACLEFLFLLRDNVVADIGSHEHETEQHYHR